LKTPTYANWRPYLKRQLALWGA